MKFFLGTRFLLIAITILGFIVWVWPRAKKPEKYRMSPPVIKESSSVSVCGWLPWWNYQRAEEEFLANKGLFSSISPFVFLLTEEGQVKTMVDSLAEKIKAYKKDAQLKVIPSIYNDLDGQRVSRILNSEKLRQQHIETLVGLIKTTGADGIEIDYEYLQREDKDAFTLFIKLLVREIHLERKLLLVTLHPKTSEPGSWHGAQAQDWPALAKEADFVRIMVYDFSWRTSGPGPIAPLGWMKEVIFFAKAQIPQEKIVVSLPFYGYDWVVDGGEAKELTFKQTEIVIQKNKGVVKFDPESRSPFLEYQDEQGRKHQVWFENKDSLLEKIEEIKKAGLAKICFWRLGDVPQSVYEFISQEID